MFYSVLDRISKHFALTGGVLLLAIVAMSIISIVGRKLFSAPIPGDMELLQVGSAVAIAAFLPLCEHRGYHLRAEAFTAATPRVFQKILDALAHLLCMLAASIIAWRTSLQAMDSYTYGGQTTLLAIPLWIPIGLIVPSLTLLAACSFGRFWQILSTSRSQS